VGERRKWIKMLNIGKISKREKIEKGGNLVKRVVITLNALPDRWKMTLRYAEGCRNSKMDELILWDIVEKGNPKVVSELEMVSLGIMGTLGCAGCGVDKGDSAGLQVDYLQNSEYVQSSILRSKTYASMESPSASVVSS